MARILLEVFAGKDEESVDNLCKTFEIKFTEPVNAFWLIYVIQQALDKETKEIGDS